MPLKNLKGNRKNWPHAIQILENEIGNRTWKWNQIYRKMELETLKDEIENTY